MSWIIALYVVRVALLISLGYSIITDRASIEGLALGLTSFVVLLLLRSADDIGHLFGAHLFSDETTALLSTFVVIAFYFDVQKMRRQYAHMQRQKRELELAKGAFVAQIAQLERLRARDEAQNRIDWDLIPAGRSPAYRKNAPSAVLPSSALKDDSDITDARKTAN